MKDEQPTRWGIDWKLVLATALIGLPGLLLAIAKAH